MSQVYAQAFYFQKGKELTNEEVTKITEYLTQPCMYIGKRPHAIEWNIDRLIENTPVAKIKNDLSEETFEDVLWDIYGITDTLSLSITNNTIAFESSRTMLTEKGILLIINALKLILGTDERLIGLKYEANNLVGEDFAAYYIDNNFKLIYDQKRSDELLEEWDSVMEEYNEDR